MEQPKYNLFLDDVRSPAGAFKHTKNPALIYEEWQVKRSYDEFVEMITQNGLPVKVSFDHDLAAPHYHESMFIDGKVYMKYLETVSEKTGMDCVKWLVNYCIDNGKKFPIWYLHTMNPVGEENMRSYINSYLKQIEHV